MRFDEPEAREAYRLGARECYESLASGLTKRRAREFEDWLRGLDAWQEFDPPPPPLPDPR